MTKIEVPESKFSERCKKGIKVQGYKMLFYGNGNTSGGSLKNMRAQIFLFDHELNKEGDCNNPIAEIRFLENPSDIIQDGILTRNKNKGIDILNDEIDVKVMNEDIEKLKNTLPEDINDSREFEQRIVMNIPATMIQSVMELLNKDVYIAFAGDMAVLSTIINPFNL